MLMGKEGHMVSLKKFFYIVRTPNGATSGCHLHGLDGSSPSVLPQDLDGLVHRHGDGEMQQQAGSHCAAEEKRTAGAVSCDH